MLVYPNITLNSQAASPPIYINGADGGSGIQVSYRQSSILITSLGLICTLSNGASLTYSVQVSADPPAGGITHWNNHDVLVAQTASANSNILYPVTALRLNVTAYSSGSVTLGVAQWP
jgi:hypothetical protein